MCSERDRTKTRTDTGRDRDRAREKERKSRKSAGAREVFFFQRGLCTLVSLAARCRVGIGPRTLLERGQTSCQYPERVGVVAALTTSEWGEGRSGKPIGEWNEAG